MSAQLLPTDSEFESQEHAARYDAWFRNRIQASVDDDRPNVTHDQAMAEMKKNLAAKQVKRSNGG